MTDKVEYKYQSVGTLKRMNKIQLEKYITDNGHPNFNPEEKHNKSQLVTKCIEVQKLKASATKKPETKEDEELYGVEGGMTFDAEKLHPDEVTMIELEETNEETIANKDKQIEYYKGELGVALAERDQADDKLNELNQETNHDSIVWKNRYNKLMTAYKNLLQTNLDITKELAIAEQITKV